MLVILSGVSGAGKDTIIEDLIKKGSGKIVTIPSYTTREKRPYEKEGREYFFVSTEEFEDLIKEEKLYEYSNHHKNYYGTTKEVLDSSIENEKIVVKDIDVNGTALLKKILPSKGIKVISIFLNIDKEEMLKRLEHREDKLSPEKIALRMSRYEFEIDNMVSYDYVIKNNNRKKTVDIIYAIIERENEK